MKSFFFLFFVFFFLFLPVSEDRDSRRDERANDDRRKNVETSFPPFPLSYLLESIRGHLRPSPPILSITPNYHRGRKKARRRHGEAAFFSPLPSFFSFPFLFSSLLRPCCKSAKRMIGLRHRLILRSRPQKRSSPLFFLLVFHSVPLIPWSQTSSA